jgi:hypothetical protein
MSKLVQDRKTGEWYDPELKLKELMDSKWFLETMKRMKDADTKNNKPKE